MEHYVTLYDSLFLPQGLALHISMERHLKDYTLWVLCVDDEVHNVLSRLSLPNVKLLQLSGLETKELSIVKPTRSKAEYCWTLTPFAPRFVFEADSRIDRVTYIDADIWFCKSPSVIFNEFNLSGKQVLITDHAYAPEYDQSATSGQFCVQFMTFTRGGGEVVRKWWEQRVIEWCFARFEDGKFGDQKYLDSWPELFSELVHVLQNKELALAPWNAIRFPYGNAIVWHFHGLRLVNDLELVNSGYRIPNVTFENIYTPYFRDLGKARDMMCRIGLSIKPQASITLKNRIKDFVLIFFIPIIRFKKAVKRKHNW